MLRYVKVVLLVLVLVLESFAGAAMNKASQDSFAQCLVSRPPGSLGTCIGISALTKLQSLDNDPEFDLVDGVTLSRDAHQPRDAYNYVDRDPSDFRSIVESLGNLMYKRILRWDMSMVYPGLAMRVSPSVSPGGVLEFVLDPQRESLEQQHSLKEASTGKLLARQFLLPFLLGFKFNVATLVPIIFGILAILAKKAFFLSKVALVISSALGLGTLLLGTSAYGGYGGHGGAGGGGYGFGHGYGPYGGRPHRYQPDDDQTGVLNEAIFRGEASNHINYGAADAYRDQQDQLRVFGDATLQSVFPREEKGRNFAWSDAEKVDKVPA